MVPEVGCLLRLLTVVGVAEIRLPIPVALVRLAVLGGAVPLTRLLVELELLVWETLGLTAVLVPLGVVAVQARQAPAQQVGQEQPAPLLELPLREQLAETVRVGQLPEALILEMVAHQTVVAVQLLVVLES